MTGLIVFIYFSFLGNAALAIVFTASTWRTRKTNVTIEIKAKEGKRKRREEKRREEKRREEREHFTQLPRT